jgi:hypothetical protein
MNLSLDATIADLVPLLGDPEKYIRRALWNLHQCTKENSGAVLTIGVTGKGIYPHYKIGTVGDHLGLGITYNSPSKVFNGSTHKEMDQFTRDQIHAEHWSTQSLDLSDLRNVLAEFMKLKR